MILHIQGSLLLSFLVFSPLLGVLALMFCKPHEERALRFVAVASSVLTFLLSCCLFIGFDSEKIGFQFAEQAAWIPALGATYTVGIDGMSLWLILLTTFLSILVFMSASSVHEKLRGYLTCLLLLEVGMLGTFVALDVLTFYVFWELMLVPMYFLIGVWGGTRRVYAALKFVLYTAFGSLLMLVAIAYLAYRYEQQFGELSFYLGDWMKLSLGVKEEIYLFSAFALAFAIKVPIFPFHTWLPDAHVEAPTGGSVILAGVLLKMGLYGLIRFGVPLFPLATELSAPIFAMLGIIGIVYGALVAWVQTDIKKLVAYSSVSHLGFCVLGFASLNLQGLQGSILQMLNHGISTAALFFLVGVLYDRKHTRQISDYGGLAQKVPLFSFVFLVFTLSSIGLPLTNGFVGEFLILLAGFLNFKHIFLDYGQAASTYAALASIPAVMGVVLGAMYMLSLYRRVVFGAFDEKKNGDLEDLTTREKCVFLPLLILVFVIGLYPQVILKDIEGSSRETLKLLQSIPPPERTRTKIVREAAPRQGQREIVDAESQAVEAQSEVAL